MHTLKKIGGSVSLDLNNNNLYIDHQNTLFHHDVTLSWKRVNDPRCENYEIISRPSCEQGSLMDHVYVTTKLSKNISSDSLSTLDGGDHILSDFKIRATTSNDLVCNETDAAMQVKSSGKHPIYMAFFFTLL